MIEKVQTRPGRLSTLTQTYRLEFDPLESPALEHLTDENDSDEILTQGK